MTRRLIGVGVGPGDPELVTVKAVRMLREADAVVVPVLAAPGRAGQGSAGQPGAGQPGAGQHGTVPGAEPGRAETIIGEYVPAERIRRLAFALNDTGGVTPRRAAAWRDAATAVAGEFTRGATTVAFGTIGDPNLYSTFSYLAQTVRDLVPDVRVETVPGITAMQDLAARAGISLAEGTEPVTLVPLSAGPGVLGAALAQGGTVVGYKVGAAASPAARALVDRLAGAGRLDGAVIGARLGLEGETVGPAAGLTEMPEVPYLSTLIVPARRPSRPGSMLRAAARGAEHAAAPGADGPGGKVWFVGAGPGAPDLLTLRAAAAVAAADVVIWASSLVHPGVLRHARPEAETVDSARLPLEGVLSYYERAARDALTVARVHSGDPALWGAVQEQLDRCAGLGLDTEVVPGVSSFTAVAARIGRELTVPEVAQSVILTRLGGGKTPMPPGERVEEFARHGTTMALFLSAARSGQLQDELLAGGYPPDTPCVVAYQVSWDDELILRCPLAGLAATIRAAKLWKHTLVLVGPGLAAGGTRSHLYHPGHFHGHRRADRRARRELRGGS